MCLWFLSGWRWLVNLGESLRSGISQRRMEQRSAGKQSSETTLNTVDLIIIQTHTLNFLCENLLKFVEKRLKCIKPHKTPNSTKMFANQSGHEGALKWLKSLNSRWIWIVLSPFPRLINPQNNLLASGKLLHLLKKLLFQKKWFSTTLLPKHINVYSVKWIPLTGHSHDYYPFSLPGLRRQLVEQYRVKD